MPLSFAKQSTNRRPSHLGTSSNSLRLTVNEVLALTCAFQLGIFGQEITCMTLHGGHGGSDKQAQGVWYWEGGSNNLWKRQPSRVEECWSRRWKGFICLHFFFLLNLDTLYDQDTIWIMYCVLGFPDGSDGKESACNVGDLGSVPGLGRSTGEANGYPLQYSCLENSMDRGAWQATVHGVAKSWTRLTTFHFHFSLCFVDMKKKKRHTLCSWDVCRLTQQFHPPPILYASVLITFISSSSSLNWESRVKTRHCDNGILCCDLWLYFSFKPQYFTLWIIMFFVGKILNLKCCRWPFIRR